MFPFFYDSMIIWFNGPSRDKLVKTLPRQTLEIGCNFIERVRPVDVVCAFDPEVTAAIPEQAGRLYYTRPEASGHHWNIIRHRDVQGTNSGILACWVATQYPRERIYIIGCDWGLSDNSTDDHIYKKGPARKYTNNIRRTMERMFDGLDIAVVNDQVPDVKFPIITQEQLLEQLTNK